MAHVILPISAREGCHTGGPHLVLNVAQADLSFFAVLFGDLAPVPPDEAISHGRRAGFACFVLQSVLLCFYSPVFHLG